MYTTSVGISSESNPKVRKRGMWYVKSETIKKNPMCTCSWRDRIVNVKSIVVVASGHLIQEVVDNLRVQFQSFHSVSVLPTIFPTCQ